GPLEIITPPANDALCDALLLTIDQDCDGQGYSNIGATMEQDETLGSCTVDPQGKTVWFKFEAPENGKATVTTDFDFGSLTDTEVTVYEAPDDCSDLSTLGEEVGCNVDGGEIGEGFRSVVSLDNLTPEETYYIQVDGFTDMFDGPLQGTFCIEVLSDNGDGGDDDGDCGLAEVPFTESFENGIPDCWTVI